MRGEASCRNRIITTRQACRHQLAQFTAVSELGHHWHSRTPVGMQARAVSLTSTVFCLFWRVPREKFFVFNYGLAPSENSDEWYQILYLHSLHVIRYIVPCVHSQNHQDAQGQKLRQLS